MTDADPRPESEQGGIKGAAEEAASASGATVQQQVLSQVETDELRATTSVLGYVQAGEATLQQSVAGAVVAGGPIGVEGGGAVALIAGEGMNVQRGGGQFLIAGGNMTVTQGGGQIMLAGGRLSIQQGGGGIIAAGHAELNDGFVAVVLAGNVSGSIRVLMSTPQAAALGAVAGAVFGLISWWLRSRR